MTSESNELLLVLPGKVTSTSIEPPRNMDYEEWRQVLFRVVQLKSAAQFWYGDLCLFAQSKFGEDSAQGISETGYAEQTMQKYCMVANRIEPLMRVKELSWSHHEVVAYATLDTQERIRWLEQARQENWNVRELKEALTDAGKRKTRSKASEEESEDICPCCGSGKPEVRVCQDCAQGIREMRAK